MRMYIGNPTKQHHDFMYRVPGARSARVQRIPVGGQIVISGDLDRDAVDMIVQHHAPYGMAAASEAEYVKDFISLLYSVDKPVSSLSLTRAMVHNNEVLAIQGKEIRRNASIVSNDLLTNNLVESGRQEKLRQMDVEILEENHDERSPDPAVSEGFRVIPGGVDPNAPTTTRRSGRRNRRAA